MNRKLICCCLFTMFVWGGLQGAVFAQQDGNFIPDKLKLKLAKKSGWFPNLDVGFNFSFSQSDGVVGVPDGTTLSFGLQLDAGIMYASGPHEWRTDLKIVHTQTKLPTLKPFLKSADQASLESIYTYQFSNPKWLGVFLSLKLDTSLLPGYLVKDADAKVEIIEVDGTKKPLSDVKAQVPLQLTEGFSPLLFKQSLGAVMTPYEQSFLKVEIKAGVGAIEAWTGTSMRVEDDAATTDRIELKRLQDYIQAGVELKLQILGVLLEKTLQYSVKVGAMLPLYSSVTNKLSTIQLLNFDFQAKLGLKLSKWLSINYALTLVQAPLIQPQLQITNNLILSLTANIL